MREIRLCGSVGGIARRPVPCRVWRTRGIAGRPIPCRVFPDAIQRDVSGEDRRDGAAIVLVLVLES
jgi:hypothetical protein